MLSKIIGTLAAVFVATVVSANPVAPNVLYERLAALQNVKVEFDLDVHHTPPPDAPSEIKIGDQVIQIRERRESYTCRFQFLAGRAMYEVAPTAAFAAEMKASATDVVTLKKVLTKDLDEMAFTHSVEGQPHPLGRVRAHPEFRDDVFGDVALGLRLPNEEQWLEPDRVKEATAENPSEAHRITFRLADAKGRIHRWLIDTAATPKVLWYTLTRPETGHEQMRIDYENFATVDRVCLPKSIVMKRFYLSDGPAGKYSKAWCTETQTYTLTSMAVGSKENVAENYTMDWKKGTVVLDDRTGRRKMTQP
jgi:hypothetical protein